MIFTRPKCEPNCHAVRPISILDAMPHRRAIGTLSASSNYAFTTKRFAGNPAAVMLMERFPADAVMQSIADENDLAETAFLVPEKDNYQIRWFTPKVEVPLCGHATLASAAVVMERLEIGRREVVFHSLSGPLPVTRTDAGYVLNFPSRPSRRVAEPVGLAAALGANPIEVYGNAFTTWPS